MSTELGKEGGHGFATNVPSQCETCATDHAAENITSDPSLSEDVNIYLID
jgi:hypothetical protein